MDDAQTAQEAIAYYREQYDAIGARLLRLQGDLRDARRDAQRQRIIATLIQQLYQLDVAAVSATDPDRQLGERLVALLIESLHLDCAALLTRSDDQTLSVEHAFGLDPGFQFTNLSELPEQAHSAAPEQLPAAVRAAIESSGLRRWLWSAPAGAEAMLFLGRRHEQGAGVGLSFEAGDQAIAQSVLAVYLALSERRRAKHALHSARIDYRTLFESAQDAFVIIDGRSNALLEANQQALSLLGTDCEQLQQRPLISWLIDPDPQGWRRRWRRTLISGRAEQLECQLRTLAGQPFWVELRLIRIGTLERGHLLLVARDISKRKQVELQLRHYAFRDELTQLPNRAQMYRRLEEALERQRQEPDYQFALMFLDLDRFKRVNDSLGHSLGDRLLVAIGQRLQGQLSPQDTIARLGGDEFLILAVDVPDPLIAYQRAQRLERALHAPFTVSGQEIFTSASIGIVLADRHYDQPEAMLRDADIAMYQAKRHEGREHRYALFNPDMHARALADMELERDLRHALKQQELMLYYQPIVRLADGAITGFEALVRWRHPQHGMVPPNRFIPLAEDTLLILDISRFVLREAGRQALAWSRCFERAPIVNVNLSGRQFISSEVATETSELIAEVGCPPALINIEITESAILTNKALALAGMEGLHAQGFKLSMDDFGTGYSSLSYLHEFPFDSIKIDQSFVSRLTREPRTAAIVTAILRLAETLEKRVIAEGIETPDQLAALQRLGCAGGQGYLFSPPVEASAAEALYKQPSWILPSSAGPSNGTVAGLERGEPDQDG
ncbi:MAG: EAL domain-containing protein [Chromatiaceae bacterium]|nr:EAL domain-containing protein [Chromatiaceae bacterium]